MNNRRLYFVVLFLLSISITVAQPNLEIIEPSSCTTNECTINLADTEVGLTTSGQITIANNLAGGLGGALEGQISFIPNSFSGCTDCTSCPNECLYFSLNGNGLINIPLNDSETFSFDFSPQYDASPGYVSIKLRITIYNDDANTEPAYSDDFDDGNGDNQPLDYDILITAKITKTQVNYCLVLDRSGSMNTTEGGERRIDLLADAVEFFLNLEQLRVPDEDEFVGDKIGMVRYDHEVDANYLPIGITTTDFLNLEAKSKVEPSATTDINRIQPRGSTATGNAVIEGINTQLTEVVSEPRKNVMILFSDGYENTGPLVHDSEVQNLLASRQDVNIYSIGMGSANMSSMQAYSSSSGLSSPQTFEYEVGIDHTNPLNDYFFKIYQNAVGLTSVVDPIYYLDMLTMDTTIVCQTAISVLDKKVIFAITHPRELKELVRFELMGPDGSIIGIDSIESISTKILNGRNHMLVEVINNTDQASEKFAGDWTLRAIALNNERNSVIKLLKNLGLGPNVPIGFSVAALSNIELEVTTTAKGNLVGEEIMVLAKIFSKNQPMDISPEMIEVFITDPQGRVEKVKTTLDKYRSVIASYNQTQQKGTYKVYVKALFTNSQGEYLSRDASSFLIIGNQQTFTSNDSSCLTCFTIKFLIVVALIILLLILAMVIRRNKT